MSENSKIEWTDHTFNPWIGCTKVSPACDHCYAEVSTPARALGVVWGPKAERRRTAPSNWKQPLRWNAKHEAFFAEHGRRQRVFCASLADVFDNAVPAAWRVDLVDLIAATPNLDWLILTKRIGNAQTMWPAEPLPNVWLGATICNQEEADRDIPKLLETPAAVRFLSMEPLLGPVDLSRTGPGMFGALVKHASYAGQEINRTARIDWVIVGGESGPGARPMSPDWARSLRGQCAAAGVPFLMKQWGEWIPMLGQAEGIAVRDKTTTPDGWVMGRAGKKAAGRLLDGAQHDGFPEAAL